MKNNELYEIASVTLRFGGFHGGAERRKVYFESDKIRTERIFYNGACDRGEILFVDVSKDDFLARFEELSVGDWDHEYDASVLDGTQWELEVEYSDGTTEEYWGSNAYPDNFRDLLTLMEMSADGE